MRVRRTEHDENKEDRMRRERGAQGYSSTRPSVNGRDIVDEFITIIYQFTILSNEMRHEFVILLDSTLKAKYLA